MNGALIYLIGFAGCGKLTIAKAIQKKIDCILVDNHLINNVIFSLIDPDGKTRFA
jgi:shikimate kinase